MFKDGKIAVLLGGGSSEAEISLLSGRAVAGALRQAGYDAIETLVSQDNKFSLPAGTSAAFIMLHGAYGEDGGVQTDLERLGVPYTGSGVESSRISFDKLLSRDAFSRAGVPVAKGYAIKPGENPGEEPRLPFPVVVKAPRQGSSVGVYLVHDKAEWAEAIAGARALGPDVLVEAFIPGREWSIPIIEDGLVLPPVEIRPKTGWYDWRNKYADDAGTGYVFPEDDPSNRELAKRAREIALAAFKAVGGRGMGRVDERITDDGQIYVLENNSIPGCTSHSILPKAAAKAEIPFPELCARILEGARCG